MIQKLQVFIIGIIIALFFFLMLWLFSKLCAKYKRQLTRKLRQIMYLTFWNGIIRVQTVSYVPTLNTLSIKFVLYNQV